MMPAMINASRWLVPSAERVPPVQRLLLSCEHPDATEVGEVVTRLMMLH
jgi:hypothetical protein